MNLRHAPNRSPPSPTGPKRATRVPPGGLGKALVRNGNRFNQLRPGPVALPGGGPGVGGAVDGAGAVPREFNTIAVDDGIAMGHGGMLYSLPSRELIADSVE